MARENAHACGLDPALAPADAPENGENEIAWTTEDEPEVVRFTLGGREIWTVALRAQTLPLPFTKQISNPGSILPVWGAFPRGTEAAVIPALPLGTGVRRIAFPPCCIRYVASCGERYFVSLNGSFQDYLGKFGAKARYNLKRTVSRFRDFSNGEIRLLEVCSPPGMRDFCELAIQISRNTWQERLGGPGFPRSEEFGAAMAGLAAQGSARGAVLFHGDRPVAYALCRAHSDCLLFARTAYDEAYAAWSPGRVLLFHLLKNLFEEKKYSYFDFGEGTLPYKQFFATDHIPCARIIYFSRNARNLAVVFGHWSLSRLSRLAGRVLQVLGVKYRLKDLLLGKTRRPGQWGVPGSHRRAQSTEPPMRQTRAVL